MKFYKISGSNISWRLRIQTERNGSGTDWLTRWNMMPDEGTMLLPKLYPAMDKKETPA